MVERFRAWLETHGSASPWVALHDYDADGVCAGVLWAHMAARLGRPSFRTSAGIIAGQSGSRNLEAHIPQLAAREPGALFVLDLGSYPTDLVPGVPTLYIDHHKSASLGDSCLNGSVLDPAPCTSLLMYDLMGAGFSHLDWIAAVGAYSDLGDKAPFAVVEQASLKYSKKALREITGLINSGRRGAKFNPEWAAQALLEHDSPQALLQSSHPCVEALRESKRLAHAAFQKAKNCAPRFSTEAALLLINTPCRVNGLLATVWKNRLPNHYVLVGNLGLEGDFIEYSSRCRRDKNVLEWLEPHISRLIGHSPQGHQQASGGRLTRQLWPELLRSLGFVTKE